jgi:hypothetical protein
MASLGFDISDNMGAGMGPDMAIVGGRKALLECLLRRFITDEGSWPADRSFGYNLARMVLENIHDVEAIRSRVEAEYLKDERVLDAHTTIRWRPTTRELFLETELEDSQGPFQFVIRSTDVTVELLKGSIDTTLGIQ